MIEVFIPFVLVLISWNDAAPSQSMELTQHLHLDEATCIAAGKDTVALFEADRLERLKNFQVEQIKTERMKYICVEHISVIEKYQPVGDR